MAEQTKIEWCDSTFNPWEGCTKVGPGCDNCYAENRNARFGGGTSTNWGPGAPRRRTSQANWRRPLKWNDEPFWQCACGWRGAGYWHSCPVCASVDLIPSRRRVFCASLADWLDNEVPIEWLVDLLDLIRRTPNLDWLLLSKRIGNWRARMIAAIHHIEAMPDWPDEDSERSHHLEPLRNWLADWELLGKAPANVWLGATVVNQAETCGDASATRGVLECGAAWIGHATKLVSEGGKAPGSLDGGISPGSPPVGKRSATSGAGRRYAPQAGIKPGHRRQTRREPKQEEAWAKKRKADTQEKRCSG